MIFSKKNRTQQDFTQDVKHRLAEAGVLNLEEGIIRHDAICYLDLHSREGHYENCFGRGVHGGVVMKVVFPPYHDALVFPQIKARYFSMKYGGVNVRWNGHVDNFSRWKDIEDTIWRRLREWKIDSPASTDN